MISEDKLIRNIRWLEKEVEGMHYPTRSGFLHIIGEFKKKFEDTHEEFVIPECITIKSENL